MEIFKKIYPFLKKTIFRKHIKSTIQLWGVFLAPSPFRWEEMRAIFGGGALLPQTDALNLWSELSSI